EPMHDVRARRLREQFRDRARELHRVVNPSGREKTARQEIAAVQKILELCRRLCSLEVVETVDLRLHAIHADALQRCLESWHSLALRVRAPTFDLERDVD